MWARCWPIRLVLGDRSGAARRVTRALGFACSLLLCVASLAQSTGAISPGVGAIAQAQNIAVVSIRGPIDRVAAVSVMRRIRFAEAGGAGAIVFDIDTPGGEVGACLDICNAIKSSRIRSTAAWINPTAYSGGAIIALACREIVVAPYATMGDALPVQGLPGLGMVPMSGPERQKILVPLLNEVVDSARRNGYDEKLVQGIVSTGVELWLIENITTGQRVFIGPLEYTRLFGTEPDRRTTPTVVSAAVIGQAPLPQSPVDPPTSAAPEAFIPASSDLAGLTGEVMLTRPTTRPVLDETQRDQWRAVEYVSDGGGLVVLKTDAMLRYALARAVVGDDQELKDYFGAQNLRRIDRSWSEALVAFLSSLPIRVLLIALVVVGLFVEMVHPGLLVPGFIAATAFVALIAPPLLIGMANWWEIAAIVVGVLLLALEIFVIPGFGVAGVIGAILILGGLLGTFVPDSPGSLFPDTEQARADMLYGLVSIGLGVATAGTAIYFLTKHFGNLPVFNSLVLKDGSFDESPRDELLSAMRAMDRTAAVGDEGVAVTALRPAGRAQFGDRIVDVVAEDGFVKNGARVRVISADQFQTRVEVMRSADSEGHA